MKHAPFHLRDGEGTQEVDALLCKERANRLPFYWQCHVLYYTIYGCSWQAKALTTNRVFAILKTEREATADYTSEAVAFLLYRI